MISIPMFCSCAKQKIKIPCATPQSSQITELQKTNPYKIDDQWYHPLSSALGFKQTGLASWYGEDFHGKKTSNGEIYDMYAMTAAHKELPMNTYVKVRNKTNNRSVVVRINDRGPFVQGRIIDLSFTAAKQLGIVGPGTSVVEIETVGKIEAANEKLAGGYMAYQIAAFKEYKNAVALRKKLAGQYSDVCIVRSTFKQQTIYKVRIGKCRTIEEAMVLEQKLRRRGMAEAYLVTGY